MSDAPVNLVVDPETGEGMSKSALGSRCGPSKV